MDQNENSTIEYPRWISPVMYFLGLVCLDFSFRGMYADETAMNMFAMQVVIFTFAWVGFLTAVSVMLPCKARKIFMAVTAAVFILLTIVHIQIYNMFGTFFTFSDMNFAGDGAKFFSWAYIKTDALMMFSIIISVLLVGCAVVFTDREYPKGKKKRVRLAVSILICAVCLFGIIEENNSLMPVNGGMSWDKVYDPDSTESDAEVYSSFEDSNRCLMMSGLYQYTVRDLLVSMGFNSDGVNVNELDKYYEERHDEISGDNEMTGTLKGKNLIMIMMESMDDWMLNEEYMPNLYKIQQESVNFENFYTALYLKAATFSTEIVSQTGLIPPKTGLNSDAYSTNAFPLSLANLFEDEGYVSKSFHSASGKIYSRGTIHPNIGFESYNNTNDMKMSDYMLDSELIKGYDLMVDEDENFFTYIITYSGHGPYTDELSNISDPHLKEAEAAVKKSGVTGSEENMEEYTLAVAHVMQTDEFVGDLVNKLKKDGLLDDTVILFYADHYSKYITDKDFLAEIQGCAYGDPEQYNTPCFMYGGGLEAETVSKYCSVVDIVPTIVNLFDLPADRAYYVGDDIFGDKGGIIPFANNEWFDGETFYEIDSTENYSKEDKAITKAIKEKETMSMNTLKSDYFSTDNYIKRSDSQ